MRTHGGISLAYLAIEISALSTLRTHEILKQRIQLEHFMEKLPTAVASVSRFPTTILDFLQQLSKTNNNILKHVKQPLTPDYTLFYHIPLFIACALRFSASSSI